MHKRIENITIFSLSILALTLVSTTTRAATNLSLGADYRLKGVSITERDKTIADTDYYEQRLQAYLITDLSRDVEANLRIQSITPWGLEDSTTPLVTPYPNANGEFWVQHAFMRLPNFFNNQGILTVGRQPIEWGDGSILSDNDIGFNAIRAQIKSPYRWLPVDLDVFTAKIDEGITVKQDTDLYGALVAFDRNLVRWEFMGLVEKSDMMQAYELGADTFSVTASKISRKIFGVRAKANLKDAFVRGEYYQQGGDVSRIGAADIALDGEAWSFGLGGRTNQTKFGRFGTVLEIMEGSGDEGRSPSEDESFRAPFAKRWDGLSRKGMGRYFAATFSDVYSSTAPFAPVTSVNDGLPSGASGIQTFHFQMDATPFAKWTFIFDFYQYKLMKNTGGQKDLGVEFDFEIVYRYSGLVTFRAVTTQFKPGEAFNIDNHQDGNYSAIEGEIRF